MLSSVPICAAFQSKSNGKYLSYNVPEAEGANNQFLLLSGDDAENPHTRFFIESSAKHNGHVHVRCCYNNKYWVAQQRLPGQWWIAGSADEPQEDLAQESCTMFELKPLADDSNDIRFFHAGLAKYSVISPDTSRANEAFQACLSLGDDEQYGLFTMVRFSQWMLPKHVCFKGDNGRYLRAGARFTGGNNFLLFESDDIRDPAVRHTTTAVSHGTKRIKSDHLGQFWRRSTVPNTQDLILPDSSDTGNNDPNTLFQAFFVRGSDMRLVNQGRSDRFCMRLTGTTGGVRDGFSAMGRSNDASTILQCEEPVLSREMRIDLKASQAKITHTMDLHLDTASATNNTSSLMNGVRIPLRYQVREVRAWTSATFRSPVRTAITSPVMYIVDGVFVTAPELFRGLVSWGSSAVKISDKIDEIVVDVPPMTKVTVTCRAVRSSYEVPFSYRQTDKLVDGEEDTMEYDDGSFIGQNVYRYQYETKEEKIE